MTNQSEFQLEEAFGLMNKLVQRNVPDSKLDTHLPDVTNVGVISGILSINEEIEVVVKYIEGLHQYTKSEFSNQVKFVV